MTVGNIVRCFILMFAAGSEVFHLPSSAIDKTEFSTSQSKSLSVSMAFFTVLDTVLSSISFVTCDRRRRERSSGAIKKRI